MTPQHWHICGMGAIGTVLAAALQAAGVPLTAVLRTREQAAARAASGFRLQTRDTLTTLQLPTCRVAAQSPISALLLVTKSYDALPALNALAPRLTSDASIVCLCNGMAVQDAMEQQKNGFLRYYGSSTEAAFRRRDDDTVVHSAHGITRIGSLAGLPAPDFLQSWQQGPLAFEWTPDMRSALWQKLAINAVINPLTASLDCRNGELLTTHRAATLALCEEVSTALAALGHSALAAGLWQDVCKVAGDTAENVSSMLQDRRAGRRTEMAEIGGYLIARAADQGVAMPVSTALQAQL